MTDIQLRASRIKLVLTDVDGVLTDNGVFYGPYGEAFVRFSRRDGMGVERLRDAGIDTAIVTRENSPIVNQRAAKLRIASVYSGIMNKAELFDSILAERALVAEQVAFIGDDITDSGIMLRSGLAACPSDAMNGAKEVAHVALGSRGGEGAFREFAEFILTNQLTTI